MSEPTDPVLAKPADLCCLRGAIHSGEAKGVVEKIGGVDTYVSKPDPKTSNGNVLLFFPDAFGLHINNFLTMDGFAACGYLTLGVDYFMGVRMEASCTCKADFEYQDPVWKHSSHPLSDPKFDFLSWKNKHLSATDEIGAKWAKDVKARYGQDETVKFACVAYWFISPLGVQVHD